MNGFFSILISGLPGWIQYPLPQHLISRIVYRATRVRVGWFKNALIRSFVRLYGVNLSEALATTPEAYASFNDFFTRPLRAGARPATTAPDALAAPVDGELARFGTVVEGKLLQAKGHRFALTDLLGGDAGLAGRFDCGMYATLYLAPRAYHRIHLPFAGRLSEMIFVPGRLFSVNDATARSVPRLFARNERVIAIFETSAGPLAVVLVGALCVGSIETVWAGEVTPGGGRRLARRRYPDHGPGALRFERNAEIGRFNMGSTVIVLLAEG
ncbi:MAG: phosphatidylserine decarboxylase, partial [Gammaproteobacteria bacterium]|nr:phosphatidylserine decarboxylase [Gammaproteobacteria bacterium]